MFRYGSLAPFFFATSRGPCRRRTLSGHRPRVPVFTMLTQLCDTFCRVSKLLPRTCRPEHLIVAQVDLHFPKLESAQSPLPPVSEEQGKARTIARSTRGPMRVLGWNAGRATCRKVIPPVAERSILGEGIDGLGDMAAVSSAFLGFEWLDCGRVVCADVASLRCCTRTDFHRSHIRTANH